jgi:hypothetical protein
MALAEHFEFAAHDGLEVACCHMLLPKHRARHDATDARLQTPAPAPTLITDIKRLGRGG